MTALNWSIDSHSGVIYSTEEIRNKVKIRELR